MVDSRNIKVRMISIIATVVLAVLAVSFVDAIPISPFVVNGTDAQIDEFPFIVSFEFEFVFNIKSILLINFFFKGIIKSKWRTWLWCINS